MRHFDNTYMTTNVTYKTINGFAITLYINTNSPIVAILFLIDIDKTSKLSSVAYTVGILI